ncbi:MAG: PqqD family protein [Desulfatibacillaceae bacterium]
MAMEAQDRQLSAVYRKTGELVRRRIADETLLVPVRGRIADLQRIYALGPVAEFIWEAIDGDRSAEEVRDLVLDAFDVGAEQAGSDVLEFLESLAGAGLVERCG